MTRSKLPPALPADPSASSQPRREFLKRSSAAVAATALAGWTVPAVHAGEDNTIRLAFIGCGSRGAGAVANAMEATGGPVQLVAMADISEQRLQGQWNTLSRKYGDRVDVPPERQFVGFDAYRKAIDCLRPGDIAMLTTRAYCRATHFDYAVEKGVNVFMEKTFAADPGGVHRMLRAGEIADEKNLKVACGLQCRHSVNRQALIQRIRDGLMGEILSICAGRMGNSIRLSPRPAEQNELEWQIRNSTHFLWASSGILLELLIHQIDECCWLKDAWPVAAHGLGGRMPESTSCGQNFDSYSIEYTFADGSRAQVDNRNMSNCFYDFATYVHGTKCAAQFSGNIHKGDVHTYKDQRIAADNIDWKMPDEAINPWQAEWNVLLDAIRNDRPHNETRRSCLSNLAAIMGRAAVHSGRMITWDEMLQSRFLFCDTIDRFATDSPAPVQENAEGRYPVPLPGTWTEI
ncbi:MAG: twin-arginine translocation signal domain-containing protein [Pirellulaceae bacterium]|nr:twin-arginine translocation signal domain-containing protein [Pirellulaceae bacterium]